MWVRVLVILFSSGTVLTQAKPKVSTKLPEVFIAPPRVRIASGCYEGNWTQIRKDQEVASFLGIPYAKPPIGERRFKKPESLETKWRNTRYVTNYRPPCLTFLGSDDGSEDCLYLNIFTKEAKNTTKQAVMVFLINDIFGMNDNSFYTPDYLLQHDVVLVTVNYRLGYFGFFTTGDEIAPGNYGVKDVLKALHWLKENIAAFGGDPDSVTLMGQGAGAGVVHLLALSEKSEGLFHKYVTQSGSAAMPWAYRSREKAVNTSMEFAASVNCTGSNNQEIVDCLRVLPASINGDNSTEIVTPWSSYGPTSEPDSEEAVITQNPMSLISSGKARDIPWLAGVVADEGLIFDFTKFHDENSTICEQLNKRFEEIIFTIADYRKSITDTDRFVASLISFYFSGEITKNCTNDFMELVEDIAINWPVFNAMSSQAGKMTSPVYFYNFAYEGTFSTTFNFNDDKILGVSHGDDVNYIFPVLNNAYAYLGQSNTSPDITMINIVTEMFTSFAKNGIPMAWQSANWKPYKEEESYMQFEPDATVSLKQQFLKDRMDWWSNITKELFIIQDDLEVSTEPEPDSSASITKNNPISACLLYFIVHLAIFAIFKR